MVLLFFNPLRDQESVCVVCACALEGGASFSHSDLPFVWHISGTLPPLNLRQWNWLCLILFYHGASFPVEKCHLWVWRLRVSDSLISPPSLPPFSPLSPASPTDTVEGKDMWISHWGSWFSRVNIKHWQLLILKVTSSSVSNPSRSILQIFKFFFKKDYVPLNGLGCQRWHQHPLSPWPLWQSKLVTVGN